MIVLLVGIFTLYRMEMPKYYIIYVRIALYKAYAICITVQTRNYSTKIYTFFCQCQSHQKTRKQNIHQKSHTQKIEVTLQSLKMCPIWNSTSDIFSRRVKDLNFWYKSFVFSDFKTRESIWNTNYSTNYAWNDAFVWSLTKIHTRS